MTKDGSNARKRAARELSEAERIPYTEALHRVEHQSAPPGSVNGEITVSTGGTDAHAARVAPPVPMLSPRSTLVGHTWASGVSGIAFHPDGRTLASGGDVTARLWDLGTAATTDVLTDREQVSCVAFQPGGEVLAVGHIMGLDAGKVSLWSTASGDVVTLNGFAGGVLAVAFSPDGRTLAVGGVDATVRLWDVATRRTTAVLEPRSGYIFSVAFSPDGRTLATSSDTVRLWDIETGQVAGILQGHTDLVQAIAFSPDGQTLATGSADKTVRLWNLA